MKENHCADCGQIFLGDTRARYCSDCRRERARRRAVAHNLHQSGAEARERAKAAKAEHLRCVVNGDGKDE